MTDSNRESHRAVVERYFANVQSGDPEIGALFAEDAVWIAPQSSPVGRRHEGRAALLEVMGKGVGLYDMDHPLEMEIDAMAAEGEHVFVETTLRARTLAGEPYRNHYVFVFRIREGLIVEIHEHLDTLYAQKLLFDPVGWSSPLDS
jgi:ketosteroid isomerase-like protein